MLVQFLTAREAKATLAEHFLEMLFCTHPFALGSQIGAMFFPGCRVSFCFYFNWNGKRRSFKRLV